MLEATAKTVATETTYTIPGNEILISEDRDVSLIRPTSVKVAEKDGKILRLTFTGPRQFAGGDSTRDARDQGTRDVGINELDLGDSLETLVGQVFDLHLRNTVHVLTEDETREVLSRLA